MFLTALGTNRRKPLFTRTAAAFFGVVLAAAGMSAHVPAAHALTLVPPMLELGGDPGSEVYGKVRLVNESAEAVELYTSTANFSAKDETGTPYFLFDEPGDLASWIQVQAGPIKLGPNERQDIPFTVSLPKEAEPGGHYAGIFFGPQPGSIVGANASVGVRSKLGMLLIMRVAGDTKVKSSILEFHVAQDQTFFTRLPVTFWYRIRNTGNLHARPYGNVVVKQLLGWTSAKVTANPVDGAVLPNSTRRLETTWQRNQPSTDTYHNAFSRFFGEALAEFRNFALGRYTATLVLSVPADVGIPPSVSFWVFPWQLLMVVLVVIILTWLVLSRGLGAYNRWVVKRYTQRQ